MFLDTKLDFQEHLNSIFSKIKKKVFYATSITHYQDRLYLQFISLLLDLISNMVTSYMIKYVSLNFTKIQNLLNKLQHLVVKSTIRRAPKEKLYNKIDLETLEQRRWYRKLCYFFKIFRHKCPKYLFSIASNFVSIYNTRKTNSIPLFKVKLSFF